jgi:hypothetical protein
LVHKSYQRLNKLIASDDDTVALQAIDKVIKLMAYAIAKEGNEGALPGTNGPGVVNVQINNFDSFLKDRLANTNIGKLLSNIDLQQTPNANYQILSPTPSLTPPPSPGAAPLDGDGLGTTQRPSSSP